MIRSLLQELEFAGTSCSGRPRREVRSPRRNKPAFTLVELLLVLTLLAIFAASLSVSLAGRPDGYAIRVAAEDLAMALRFAATQAKAGQTSHRVAFYENHAQYRVEIADPRTNGGFAPARGQAGQMNSIRTPTKKAS